MMTRRGLAMIVHLIVAALTAAGHAAEPASDAVKARPKATVTAGRRGKRGDVECGLSVMAGFLGECGWTRRSV